MWNLDPLQATWYSDCLWHNTLPQELVANKEVSFCSVLWVSNSERNWQGGLYLTHMAPTSMAELENCFQDGVIPPEFGTLIFFGLSG